jgi:hypothetical protein
VSNFLKYIDARFREHFIPGQNLSVDESVVGFKRKISFITYNPKKPTKWESVSMFWQNLPPAMSAPSSPTMAKSPQRASSNQTFLLHPQLFFNFSIISDRHGLTSAVITFLLTDFIQASELSNVRCHLTGTVMTYRKDVPAVMKKPKQKKGEKATYRNNENILLLAWCDKCLVTVLSTRSTSKSEPVRRKVRGRKEEEMVEKPSVIANHMKNMGGVDTADRFCATYCFL